MDSSYQPRFKPGDVLDVTIWNHDENVWDYGVIEITSYSSPRKYSPYGMYGHVLLSGEYNAICTAADIIDNYCISYIGRITDPAVAVLFGRQDRL